MDRTTNSGSGKGVVRRAAVEMRASRNATEAEFIHDICAGIVRYERDGVFGASSGLFFSADLGEENGQPKTMNFFIPRSSMHDRLSDDTIVIRQRAKYTGSGFEADGYPDDVDVAVARGDGSLKLIIREG